MKVIFTVFLMERKRKIYRGRVGILFLNLASYNFNESVCPLFCVLPFERKAVHLSSPPAV